jgi:signal peptidase I
MDEPRITAKPRKPWVAVLLSLILPGLGQLYAGEPWRGLAVYLGSLVVATVPPWIGLPKTFPGLIVFVLMVLCYVLWTLWDAVRVARRNRDYVLRPFNRWYWYFAAVLVINISVSQLIVPKLMALSSVKSFKITSGSMEPAVRMRDHLFADMTYYRSAKPSRGDLVVFTPPKETYVLVKRIIGLPRERVEIRDKVVYIDGRRLEDSWGHYSKEQPEPGVPSSRDNLAAVAIPDNQVFLIGDNRDLSYDSRFFGPVPVSSLQGRLLYVYWSPYWSRIGRSLR